VEQIFENPQHPYTKALLAAIPVPDPSRRSQRVHLEGDVPSPISPPSGCHFHTRCPVAEERCSRETPAMQACEKGHHAACFLAEVSSST
jgi:oligopeptide/dipeptide ABC transporter ATP-binding protein